MPFVSSTSKNQRRVIWFVVLMILFLSEVSFAQFSGVQTGGNIQETLEAGRKALDEDNTAEALELLQSVIAVDDGNVEAYYRLGQTYWKMRNSQEALKSFDKASELGKDNASLQMSLAGFYEQVRMMDRAVEHYRKVINIEGESELGKNAEKRLNLVLVKEYAQSADVDTALQLLQSMLEEYPDDLRVLQHLGFAYLLANRFESAAAIYEEVLEKDPNNDSAHMNIAGVYEKMGNLAAAIKHFELAGELALTPSRQLESRIRAGLLTSQFHYENGEIEAAIEALKGLLELKPDFTVASNRLSKIYMDQGNDLEAQKTLEEALAFAPEGLDMRLNLASIYAKEKNFIDAIWELSLIIKTNGGNNPFAPRARELMRQVATVLGDGFERTAQLAEHKNALIAHLTTKPDDPKANFDLGTIYVGQRRYDKAKQHFETVVKVMPAHGGSYLYLGEINASLNDNEAAFKAFGRYIALEPDLEKIQRVLAAYTSTLARYLLSQKKDEHALHHFKRAVEFAENDAYAWYQIGLLLSRRGEMEEAIAAYDTVLSLVSKNSLARYNRALLYERLGRESDAFTEYQQIVIDEQKGSQLQVAAESKVKYLKARLNGLTASANYSYSFNDNSNLSEFNPRSEQISSLSASFSYRYRYDDDWLFGGTYGPTYTTYHIGHFDFLIQTFEPFVTYGKRGDQWNLSLRFNQQESLLNEEGVSNRASLELERSKSLSDDRRYSIDFNYETYEGASTSRFDSDTYSLKGNYSRSLGKGISDGFSYTLTYLNPIEEANADAEYVGNTFGYNASKWFSQKLAVSGNVSVTRNLYLETDRFTRLANSTVPPTKRLTTLYSMNVSLNYRHSDKFRFYSSLSYQVNRSNLPVLVFIEGRNGEPDIIRPVRSEELVGVPLTSSSLGPYKKLTLSFGVGINF